MNDGPNPHGAGFGRTLPVLANRRRIYQCVARVPGLHLRRLARELGMSLGTLQHHVKILEARGLITSRQDGKRRGYFLVDQVDPRDQHVLYYLRQPSTRRVLVEMLASPTSSVTRLSQRLPIQAPTVSYHLKRLCAAGLVRAAGGAQRDGYEIVEPDHLRAVIESYRPTFRNLTSLVPSMAPIP